jgi:hypothetical protein
MYHELQVLDCCLCENATRCACTLQPLLDQNILDIKKMPPRGAPPHLQHLHIRNSVHSRDCKVGPLCLPFQFVDSPELHGGFKCCPISHISSAFSSTFLALFCTPATFTPTGFPRHSPPCHLLFTSHLLFLLLLCPAPYLIGTPDSHMLSLLAVSVCCVPVLPP